MGETSIEWTDKVWNPVAGCSVVSPGCTNCYAMKMAHRIEGMNASIGHAPHYAGLTKKTKAGAVWTGKIATAPDSIFLAPLRWRKPARVFANSMADLFHEDVPDETIDRVFAVMALTPQHTYQILTKRSARMRAYTSDPATILRIYRIVCDLAVEMRLRVVLMLPDGGPPNPPAGPQIRLEVWPLPNVWLGVSTEDQPRADERIPDLLETPAAVRFLSVEPMLGPVDLEAIVDDRDVRAARPDLMGFKHYLVDALTGTHGMLTDRGRHYFPASRFSSVDGSKPARIDLAIVGGESGPRSRPFQVAWAAAIVDQCKAAGVAVFVKQLGAKPVASDLTHWRCGQTPLPGGAGYLLKLKDRKGGDMAEWPENLRIREMPQKGDNSP